MSATPHGTVLSFAAGCRSVGGCPYQNSELLTCAEAVTRRRADFHAARLPPHQPIPRVTSESHESIVTPVDERAELVHGTPWGYRRGCRDECACPHWRIGRVTCAQARRRYVAQYRARRLQGIGKPIEHGTSRGALAGCSDETVCPRGADGLTCAEARRRSRQAAARLRGVRERVEPVDAAPVLPAIAAARANGWSLRRIAAAAGCGVETIRRLVAATVQTPQRPVRVLPETYNRLARLDSSMR